MPYLVPMLILTMMATVTACENREEQITESSDNSQPSILIQKRGELMYRPNERADYQPSSLNMELYPDNWLQQKLGGPSKIRCAKDNPTSQDIYKLVSEGEHSLANLGCPLVARTQSGSITVRAVQNLKIPFIIAPRRTAVLDARPKIRWNPVSGVSQYTVSLKERGVSQEIWTTKVSDRTPVSDRTLAGAVKYIELDYPADAPSLEPEVDYQIIVTTQKQVEATDNCPKDWLKQLDRPTVCLISSTRDTGRGLGFYLLSQDKIQQVQKLAAEIEREFDGEAKALALAHLYRENNLMMDAIATLKDLLKQGNHTTGVYRFLGELYQQSELNQLAELQYVRAIELAKDARDLVGQASAQSSLAEILAAKNANQKAIEIAQEAKNAYEILGDTAKVAKLQQKLSQWQSNS